MNKMNIFNQIVDQELLGATSFDKNMTFAVKANIGCGYNASASTPSLCNWIPQKKDGYSPVVKQLVDAGHRIVAITNMHELAFGITSENPGFGDVDNPRKHGYIPGGSSGGSAAAVAINAVSFALGTDTGGSMRIPAALCGVVGYRPTIGLYSALAVCPLSSTTDTIGIFANRVTTVQQAHKAIEQSYIPELKPLSGVKIGVPRRYYYSVLDKEVSRITEAALQSMREAGVELVECDIDLPEYDIFVGSFFDLITYETGQLLPKYLKDQDAPVSFKELCEQISDPVVKKVIMSAKDIPEEKYKASLQVRQETCRTFDAYFKTNQLAAFVVPTTILPAVKRPSPQNVEVNGQDFPTLHAYTHNSIPQASAGVPCISLPSGVTADGLPVGLELVAPQGMDSDLLNLAAAVQDVLPSLPQLSFANYKKDV